MDKKRKIISCPLNCGGKIDYENQHRHFKACRLKNLLDDKYLRCKYDQLHIIEKRKLKEHEKNCEIGKRFF